MPERRVLGDKLEELPGLAEPLDRDAVTDARRNHAFVQFLQVASAHVYESRSKCLGIGHDSGISIL